MNKIKFGVIGAGGIARRKTIPGMLDAKNCELAAVMDVHGVDALAEEFGVRGYASEKDLLADADIQAVYIASPVFAHGEQILAAASAKKHILCEKPLTLTLAEAQQAVASCTREGVFLQEGYMMKFHGAHRTIKDMIDQGELGRIVSMRAQLSCWFPSIPGAWRQDPALGGGGALMDMATHLYDLLEYFAGPVNAVTAFTDSLVHDYASEDASTTLLRFTSGAHATVDCFFCIPDEAPRTRLEIYGTQGAVLTEGTIGQSVAGTAECILGLGSAGYDATQDKDVERAYRPLVFPEVNPYTAECEYFADCIITGKAPAVNSVANALHVLDLALAAYESSRTGQVVELPFSQAARAASA